MYKKILASGLTVSMLLVGLSNANAEENQITEKTLT